LFFIINALWSIRWFINHINRSNLHCVKSDQSNSITIDHNRSDDLLVLFIDQDPSDDLSVLLIDHDRLDDLSILLVYQDLSILLIDHDRSDYLSILLIDQIIDSFRVCVILIYFDYRFGDSYDFVNDVVVLTELGILLIWVCHAYGFFFFSNCWKERINFEFFHSFVNFLFFRKV
jgi:hypothetical protein